MKWSIGLDLRPTGRGALAFVRWLRAHLNAPEQHVFAAVHAVEEASLLQSLRFEHMHDLELRVQAAAEQELVLAGLSDTVEGPHIVADSTAEQVLTEECDTLGAQAIVIGRRASTNAHEIVRLGRVARRLLRVLPAPTIVVPGDLQPEQFGDGPIMLATDLEPSSAGAARFALELSRQLGRGIVVAHVIPHFDTAAMLVPAATIEQLYSQLGLAQSKSLDGWMRTNGLGDAASAITTGDVIGRLLGIAERERCPILVSGSRKLSLAERLFNASIGATLAGHAKCAVAVVPEDYRTTEA